MEAASEEAAPEAAELAVEEEPPQAVRAAAAAAAPQMDRNERRVIFFIINISFGWAGPTFWPGCVFLFLVPCCLSRNVFIVARRPSCCDHTGAKCR